MGEQRKARHLDRACNIAVKHLRLYAANEYKRTGPRWDYDTTGQAIKLMRALFLGTNAEILAASMSLRPEVTAQVQVRFALSCRFMRINGAPGQQQEWYSTAAASAAATLDGQPNRSSRQITIEVVHADTLKSLLDRGRLDLWDPTLLDQAERLLHLCFFGPERELATLVAKADARVQTAVQYAFVRAFYRYTVVKGTPGQNQPWFQKVLSKVKIEVWRSRQQR